MIFFSIYSLNFCLILQILIQAVSGNSNVSVIAIDDFKISSDCEDIPKSTF